MADVVQHRSLVVRWGAADRKAEIMDAAVSRIVRFGVEGLRVRDVAQDVGINNATLHYHFPTKTALVAALVQRFVAGFSLEGGVPDDGPLDDRLTAYVELRRRRMRRDPDPFLVLAEFMVLARRDGEVKAALLEQQDRWRDYLATVCREAGLDVAAATDRADRCRRELLGACLELGLSKLANRTNGDDK